MSVSRDEIAAFLRDQGRVDPDAIDDQAPLFSSGMLDSFLMVELIVHLESVSGLKFPPDDITLDNFDTIAAILEYCRQRKDGV